MAKSRRDRSGNQAGNGRGKTTSHKSARTQRQRREYKGEQGRLTRDSRGGGGGGVIRKEEKGKEETEGKGPFYRAGKSLRQAPNP